MKAQKSAEPRATAAHLNLGRQVSLSLYLSRTFSLAPSLARDSETTGQFLAITEII
jgi:hypothetical protein